MPGNYVGTGHLEAEAMSRFMIGFWIRIAGTSDNESYQR